MSNETKIGLLTVVAIALSVWGFKFIQGKNLLTSSNFYYIEYDHIDGLATSSPVSINGYPVGIVSNLTLQTDKQNSILVELDINNGVNIPKNAVAKIVSIGLLGGKGIVLEFPNPCQGTDCAPSGSLIKGRVAGMFESMIGKELDVNTYVEDFKGTAKSLVDSLLSPDKQIGKSLGDLEVILNNLKRTTFKLDKLMDNSSGQLSGILSNANSISNNLKNSNAEINNIIKNASDFTNQLKTTDLNTTLTKANGAIDEATNAISGLKSTVSSASTTMENADAALNEMKALITKLNSSDGTLGKLIEDDGLYIELNKTLQSIDKLANDLKDHPYRYVPLKSKRKVEKYDKQLDEK